MPEDIVAPAIYYNHIEASLGIVTVSLPSLWPLFRGVSLEKTIAGVRSFFSLHSNSGSFASSEKLCREHSMQPTPAVPPIPPIPPPVYGAERKDKIFMLQPLNSTHGKGVSRFPIDDITSERTSVAAANAV